jgi:hypothetical protein
MLNATTTAAIVLYAKIPGLPISLPFTPHPTDSMPLGDSRRQSARYINRIAFAIQDNADDEVWNAAQSSMLMADAAHREGDFGAAREHIDEAQRMAFPTL